MLKNVRVNPVTGEHDYYFPMEIIDKSDLDYAKEYSFDVDWARLGFRKFKAIFVPCRYQAIDSRGRVIFLDTPSDAQRSLYLGFIKDELDEQEDVKQDGRCPIPNGRGGTKRCPARIPNPDDIPGGASPRPCLSAAKAVYMSRSARPTRQSRFPVLTMRMRMEKWKATKLKPLRFTMLATVISN